MGISDKSESTFAKESNVLHDKTTWITKNAEIEEIKRKAQKVAKERVPVLITGENGTGKEVLAKYIYQNSASKEVVEKKPFVTVNCGAIPSE